MDFCTNRLSFRQMERAEVKQLEVGEKIAICINYDPPKIIELVQATVVRPMFWNCDADEPGWELETTNGFVDINSIYEIRER